MADTEPTTTEPEANKETTEEPTPVTTEQPKKSGAKEGAKKAVDKTKEGAQKATKAVSDLTSSGFREEFGGCFSDIFGCLMSCFCPCVVEATNRSLLDERPCTIWDAICFPNPYQTRQSIRVKYSMPMEGTQFIDCLGVWCCNCCIINQHAREIGNRNGKGPVFIPAQIGAGMPQGHPQQQSSEQSSSSS